MNNQDTLKLKLTIDEVNKILNALGNLPFSEVFELIGKIQQQAQKYIPCRYKAAAGKTRQRGIPHACLPAI